MVRPVKVNSSSYIPKFAADKVGLVRAPSVAISGYSDSSDDLWKGLGIVAAVASSVFAGMSVFGRGLSLMSDSGAIDLYRAMFTKEDVDQIVTSGRRVEDVARDMAVIAAGKEFAQLVEPATVENGRIRQMDPREMPELIREGSEDVMPHMIKFVPASGAATRMFKVLNHVFGKYELYDQVVAKFTALSVEGEANSELETLDAFMRFWEDLEEYPFFGELKAVMEDRGLSLAEERGRGHINNVLGYLLTPDGLGYARKPKLFLTFHLDDGIPRTAMEEQVKEAVWLSRGKIHFTVSPEFREQANVMARELTEAYADKGIRIDISFSEQAQTTDTIAMRPDGAAPFRMPDGRLYFRPSGHGALLSNLNAVAQKEPFVLVQNIDNLPGAGREIMMWKMAFLGEFARLQSKVHGYVKALRNSRLSDNELAKIFGKVTYKFKRPIDLTAYGKANQAGKQDILFDALNRPLVLSAMVPNKGEPGGGPFSVMDPKTGRATNQITEGSQIDKADHEQRAILERSTHFNPVFQIIGTRDAWHRPFNLKKFAVREGSAIFIVDKSHPVTGEPFRSLDTGLYQGSLHHTLHLFMEMPGGTFGPAKTVFDLSPDERPFRAGTPYRDIVDFRFSEAVNVSSALYTAGREVPRLVFADRVSETIDFAQSFAAKAAEQSSAAVRMIEGRIRAAKERATK